jgi:hypothetical protein
MAEMEKDGGRCKKRRGGRGNGGRGRDEGLMFVLQGALLKDRDDH